MRRIVVESVDESGQLQTALYDVTGEGPAVTVVEVAPEVEVEPEVEA